MNDPNKYKKHNLKRQRISLSIYEEDKKILLAKFGFIPTAAQIKKMLFGKEFIVITRNINPQFSEMIVQLKAVGNNINQLAFLANSQMEIPPIELLSKQSEELQKALQLLFELKNNDSKVHKA